MTYPNGQTHLKTSNLKKAVRCWSLLQFLKLSWHETVMSKNNLILVVDLHYCIYSLAGKKNSFIRRVG